MKLKVFLLALSGTCLTIAFSQSVGIGTSSPNVTATSCTIKVTNLASDAVTISGTWSFWLVGPK